MSFSPYFGSTGLNSGVKPLVITGNRLTGQGSDSTLQGFVKFNAHEHWRANPADFRFYNISLNDEVYLYDAEGNNVIGNALPATVSFISGTKLRLTVSSTTDVENGILLLKYDKSVIIGGVSIDAGTNVVYFYSLPGMSEPGLPGFISPQTANSSLSWVATGVLNNPTAGLYPLLSQLPEDSWLVSAAVQTTGDVFPHCDCQFKVNVSGSNENYGELVTATDRPSIVSFVPDNVADLASVSYPIYYGRSALPSTTSVLMEVLNVNPAVSSAYASNILSYTLRFHKVIKS